MRKRASQSVALLLALTGAYFAAGKLGLSLAFAHPSASAVWPPTGLAVAAVLLLGYRVWPAILLGSFLVNLSTAGTAATSLGIAAGNTLEAVLGAWLAARFAGGARAFDRPEGVMRFILLAAVPATAISATVGVTSLASSEFVPWELFPSVWLTWCTGNLVSMMTVAPLVLIWATTPAPRMTRQRWLEAALLLVVVLALGFLMFGGGLRKPFDSYPIGIVALVPLLWAAFRFQQQGAVTTSIVLCAIAVGGTLAGYGPFKYDDPNLSLLLLQAFVGVATVTALMLAAAVADRARAEAVLRDQEQHLSMALSSGRMGTWQWDIASGRVKWSPRLEQIHGLKPGEFRGSFQAFLDDVHPDDVVRVKSTIGRNLSALSDHEIQYRLKRRDGEIRWVEGHGHFVLDKQGNALRLVGVCMDVTDRKIAEAEREKLLASERDARRQAEEASSAKDQFLAVLSHELRTPLTPVMLTASQLERSPELPEAFREDIRTIRRNVELEARLIDDLLDLTRVTHGKLELALEPTDVHELLMRVIDICCPGGAGQLQLDLAAPRAVVSADAARLQQVFWNLLSNAVKFSPPGRPIVIRSDVEDGQLLLKIVDSGPGIEPEFMPRLFRPFEQGKAARNGQAGGLGLGLAISRGLVTAHGGSLEAHSDGPGTGATFAIRLPLAREPAQPAREEPPAGDQSPRLSRTLRILLVEDHESTLAVLRKLLASHGHEVTTATSNQSALAAAEEGEFDLVISDLGLPDGLAYELMGTLRRRWGIRGIALSGYGAEADVVRTRASGFAEHLTKPVDLETLLEAIERVTALQEATVAAATE